MDDFVKTVCSGSLKEIARYLDGLDQQRSQDYMLKTCGADKGSIVHMFLNAHLKDKPDVTIAKLEVLVKHGAKLEQKDTYGNNAVLHVVKLGKHRLTEWLIEKCKDPIMMERNHCGMNIFHISALYGKWYVFELTRKKLGQELSQKLMNQKTKMMFNRYIPTLGKTVSVRSWTPLHFCSIFCHLDCVKWLVKHGVNTKATNAEGLMAEEFYKVFTFVKSEAAARHCYGYIVAKTKTAKTEKDFEISQKSFSVCLDVTSKSSPSEESLDKNLTPRRHSPEENSKIIQDLDAYLLNYGFMFRDLPKELAGNDISNLPQLSKETKTFEVEEEKSNEPIEDKSDEPLGGTRPSMLTTHDHVRNIEDKDLIFIQNIIGDYLSQHDVKYEALLEEIKERFVVKEGSDSDGDCYGHCSPSFESCDSDDLTEEDVTDEKVPKLCSVGSTLNLTEKSDEEIQQKGIVELNKEDTNFSPERTGTSRDTEESDEETSEEEIVIESIDNFRQPVFWFSQKDKNNKEMRAKTDAKLSVIKEAHEVEIAEADKEDIKLNPVQSSASRDIEESNEQIPEDDTVASIDNLNQPTFGFSQKNLKAQRMVIKADTKKEKSGNKEEDVVESDKEDIKHPLVRSNTSEDLNESDAEVPEEDIVELTDDFSQPILDFSQKNTKTKDMVAKTDTKKETVAYPCDATIRDIASEITSHKLTLLGRFWGLTANEVAAVEPGRTSEVKAKTLLLKWRENQRKKHVPVSRVKECLDALLQKLGIDNQFEH